MATYLFVHGAWHGGWCWNRVGSRLRTLGHEVIAPTLPGLGEGAAELTPSIGLGAHADAIVAELAIAPAPVVLVGHSYAGFVVRQAADQLPGAVDRIVLIDAWFGSNGESLFDRAPDWFRSAMQDMAASGGVEWIIPPPSPEMVGVTDPADQAWLLDNLTPQPIRSFTEPTQLTGAVDSIPASAIVVDPSIFPFRSFADAAGYPVAVLESGHDAMVTAPGPLTELLSSEPSTWGS
jgi:pimeloyl-ACP methyl ester carboxylesterase